MPIPRSKQPPAVAALAILALSCMDAAMKVVSMAYPLGEVVGLRYAAGSLAVLAVCVAWRQPVPTWGAVRRNALRAVLWLVTASCFFAAVARLPLAEAVALTFLAPILISCLGWLILAEPVSRGTLAGVGLGLVGVVVITLGHGLDGPAPDPVGVAAALGCAFFYAWSTVLMRKQSRVDSIFTMVLLPNCVAFLLASPVMVATWHAPTGAHLALFGLAGALGACGHFALAWAYARAPAATLGVFEYTAFVWAGVLGFVVFAEVPTAPTLVGALIIVAACVLPNLRPAAALASAEPTP